MEIEYKNKKRFLIGIIIVLIIINLTALGTLSYHKYHRTYHNVENSNPKGENRGDRIKHFVKKELNLNEEQCSIYYQSMDKNFSNTRLIYKKIANCKNGIIEQILAENPDTIKINLLCDSIGIYNRQIQCEMNRHLMDIKKSLNSEQKVKLKEILIRINKKDWRNQENNKKPNAVECKN